MEAENPKRKSAKLFALFNPILSFFKPRRRRTRFMDLPRVIMVEILSKLPIESMLSSRQVCKLWYNLFSDPLFLTMYKSRSPPPCILFSRDHDISQLLELEPCCDGYSSRLCNRPILLSYPEFNTPVNRGMDIPVEDYPMLRLIGSCNGFIGLMTNIYDINTSVYISNPLLGEYFKLKLPELEKSVYRVVYGFCFTEVSKKYKLVRSRRFEGHREVSELEVYTLGVDGKWRNLGQVPYPVWHDFGQIRGVSGLDRLEYLSRPGPCSGRDKLGIKARFMVPGYLRNRVSLMSCVIHTQDSWIPITARISSENCAEEILQSSMRV
ncbi:hypothetical protein T459_29189 [Capsicum annuum]|uniref:F-box domain-containing protein n=1 Tax=Capsicum annuum TaxID=4072 RepID=A0A2G2Y4W2_CAPAN|nr:hypothetical protein T459_29189 [Capsicum annuum]